MDSLIGMILFIAGGIGFRGFLLSLLEVESARIRKT